MSAHEFIPVSKIGEETGRVLQRATCSCGWVAGVWFSSPEYVTQSFERHANPPVCTCTGSPWVLGAVAVGYCPIHGIAWGSRRQA